MSSLSFLVTEFQSLSSETKRKHPDVREAADHALAVLKASPDQTTATLASDGARANELLRPVFMGCATRNAKVVAIALGSLQRLIALKGVPESALPAIVSTMNDCMSQGVDIQLRILQTILSLVTNCPNVHGSLMGDALLLCFKLQESRIAVVSSTAAATLRQLVMFIVEKVADEERKDDVGPLVDAQLPDGTTKALGASAHDAFSIFEDLCLLANSDRPHLLRLESLPKTFALELIESVLTNYHALFLQHDELLMLLRHDLCPLILRILSDRPVFALTLRATRVVFLLLKQFLAELSTEAEVFLMLLIRTVGDVETGGDSTSGRPHWLRVMSMEVIRGLCTNAELVRNVWQTYDAQHEGSNVFASLITALNRLVTEKPALLGTGTQMAGLGVVMSDTLSPSSSSSYGLDVGGMAGRVANAASATVSGVVGMMGSTIGGLSLAGSSMKLQCIDQLDKADSPPIPEAYIYLLALQCLVALCDGFAAVAGPLYNTIVIQRPKAAGEATVRAPPALDVSTLPADEPSTIQLKNIYEMVQNGWPGLLAALSFVMNTNLSDELFADVLASYQNMTNVAGMLGLSTPRDTFLTSLSRYAVPTLVVTSVESYSEPMTPRSTSVLSADNLGLGAAAAVPPGLSERNMACLKVLVSCTLFLAGSLGKSWFDVLEALQNADYVLTAKGTKQTPAKRPGSANPTSPPRQSTSGGHAAPPAPPVSTQNRYLLAELDAESCLSAIRRLFDATKNLEDGAFSDFTIALCRLSAEMVGMQADSSNAEVSEATLGESLSADAPHQSHRRRVSGIHLPRVLRSGDFGISRLGSVALLNIHRVIYRSPEVAWNTITGHLLSVLLLSNAPQPIRLQAARILDDILLVVPRNLSSTGELQSQVQRRVLDVLAQQVVSLGSSSTSIEIRRMGLETLHQILQSSGHTLVVGWETVFEMLGSVCRPDRRRSVMSIAEQQEFSAPPSPITPRGSRPMPLGLGQPSERSYNTLIKIAFQSLTLVCDGLTALSPVDLRLCISTLGSFGRQPDTNIALTSATSLLWGVSDAIQMKRKDAEQEPEYSALWMFLLTEILGLCADGRPEVRSGAIQTLFRTLQLYGATLSLETWGECLWKVAFPLIDALSSAMAIELEPPTPTATTMSPDTPQSGHYMAEAWAESKTLALQSVGSIFSEFMVSKIMHLPSFEKAWDTLIGYIQASFLNDPRLVSAAAVRSLEKAVKASGSAERENKALVNYVTERAWKACDDMGAAVMDQSQSLPAAQSPGGLRAQSQSVPFTQDSLLAFVEMVRTIRHVSCAMRGAEWTLERLTRLMSIMKGVITYPNSYDYRVDVDALTPIQGAVLDSIAEIDLSVPGSPSLILRDLAEYTTLAFVAPFDVPEEPMEIPTSPAVKSKTRKQVTYIAVTKKTMPLLVELCLRFRETPDIYVDGTLEAVLSAYAIPMKLKYDCPSPSKFGKAESPLWKTATTNFLRITRICIPQIREFGSAVPDERVEGIWHQTIDVFRGAILADCSVSESYPLDMQESEEDFDLALVAALEMDVYPQIGDPRVPDYLISQLARVLHHGSRLHTMQDGRDSYATRNGKPNSYQPLGTTQSGVLVPRERFSYWCFDLLFLISSDSNEIEAESRRRVASLSVPSLLDRCRTTLAEYVADESLRGNIPFPRAREEELLYVLRKLLDMQLWSGCLWAAFSDNPTQSASELPPIDASLPPSDMILDATKRSPRAHLFHLYNLLVDIASTPRRSPTAWIISEQTLRNQTANGVHPQELDARRLARACLKELGKDMGLAYE